MKHYYKYENGYFVKKNLRRGNRGLGIYSLAITLVCVLLVIGLVIAINAKEDTCSDESTVEENVTSKLEEEKAETEAHTAEAVLSSYGPSDTYYYDISYEDKVTIAKVVYAESRGECFEGKVAVAAVILNRYFSNISYFDTESILAVVTQPYQFASIEGVTEEKLENYPDCMKAVEVACKGWDPTREMFEEGALYFYAPSWTTGYQAEIREGIQVLVIGNHNFHYDFEKVN